MRSDLDHRKCSRQIRLEHCFIPLGPVRFVFEKCLGAEPALFFGNGGEIRIADVSAMLFNKSRIAQDDLMLRFL